MSLLWYCTIGSVLLSGCTSADVSSLIKRDTSLIKRDTFMARNPTKSYSLPVSMIICCIACTIGFEWLFLLMNCIQLRESDVIVILPFSWLRQNRKSSRIASNSAVNMERILWIHLETFRYCPTYAYATPEFVLDPSVKTNVSFICNLKWSSNILLKAVGSSSDFFSVFSCSHTWI